MVELPDDLAEFTLLEDYLQRLQAGQRPDREGLLREHPRLRSVLDCLDALEGIAPEPRGKTIDAVGGEPSSPVALPRDFGAYELLEEIGRGGMGVVYKARQKALDRIVAVKMILAGHLASAEHVRRFQDEARAAARVRHSHIVHIHEVGEFGGQHYFTMEYVEGTSLAAWMARGPASPDKAIRIVEQVARAVAHLHRQGIVHRDLKPSNILLDDEEQPYVTDFGLAKFFGGDSQATATGVIVGTPCYMAPEQAAGRNAEVGPWSDVYSLGAILYELLTGRPPFREETPLDTVMQVLSGEPPLPRRLNKRIPRALERIVMKCLAKSPPQRYSSAEALADDLKRFMQGEALEAKPPHLGLRLARWARRQPALASHLAVLGVFFFIENINAPYALNTVDWTFHGRMLALMAVWLVSSVLLEQSLKIQRWSVPARFIWGALDSALLLAVLLVSTGVNSALVVGYPMLIVGSGLWFRVRFVWYMTALSLLTYGILVLDFYFRRYPQVRDLVERSGPLRDLINARYDRHVFFAIMLVATGAIVAFLVGRVRTLNKYYGGGGDEG
jgi:serine/threonine-protein kinase